MSLIFFLAATDAVVHVNTLCLIVAIVLHILFVMYFVGDKVIMTTSPSKVSPHWFNSAPQEKMATQFPKWYFQMHFCEWKFLYFDQISRKFVPKGTIDNNLALV